MVCFMMPRPDERGYGLLGVYGLYVDELERWHQCWKSCVSVLLEYGTMPDYIH